jgi:hypothetical protein
LPPRIVVLRHLASFGVQPGALSVA